MTNNGKNGKMDYYIKLYSNKPKEDINQIVERMGYKNLAPNCTKNSGWAHLAVKTASLFAILRHMKRGDHLLIQYPMKKFVTPAIFCAHLKHANVTILIHDLGCFRRKKLTVAHEMRRMNRADRIIAHNPAMQKFMQDNHCTTPITTLGIFDYLTHATPPPCPPQPWRIAYAGGLSPQRTPFIYQLDTHIDGWQLHLYGKQYDPKAFTTTPHNIHYHGNLPPDQLIQTAQAHFGLVWDGPSPHQCTGPWGEYLLINNPHKTSFYLRAHLPVIIWSKAAIAPFILQHQAGIAIDSLYDINNILRQLTPDQYATLRQNATHLSQLLAEGHFTQQALRP